MTSLDEIREPVKEDLKQFESFFFNTMKSDIPLLRLVLNYIMRRKGKQMRPLLVFLSAAMNGTISESTHVAATLIELLHTASLAHDDVVDDATERRGMPSINALWNSKIAVLLGDFLLAKGLLVSVDHSCFDMLHIVSDAVQSMAEGELLQIQKVRRYNVTEEEYYKVISCKTAALISACAMTGTRSVTSDSDSINRMKEIGENIGMAFQIRDDILDYSNSGNTGKKSGNDIKEGKITLPLIHSLDIASLNDKRRIISIIKNKNKTSDDISAVMDFVKANNGLQYAEEKMNIYSQKALSAIEAYPDSPYKKSFIEFIHYTTNRDK
ncbi:MAG: polyprenyl synthetase family protein [Bacteroidales bacterium]|nr:polyprenyl synthetase family protein [Bacteroidales bacterium]